jgi:O-glycosyl hydrolase
MNATSRLRPASTGRFYTCFISYINYIFEEGVPAVALSISNMEEVYEGLTGLSFRRIVRQVSGEIAR